MRGVNRFGCGVEFLEHRADECSLADVLGDADPLLVRGMRDRRVGAVTEPDRGCVQAQEREFTRASGNSVAS
jgi:hypothetical protein